MLRFSRRKFLKVAGFSALALAGCQVGPAPTAAGTAAPGASATWAPPSLASAPADIRITPVEEFYRQSYGPIPDVNGAGWRLTIDGLVEKPTQFSLDELRALPAVEEIRTLECIGNPVGGSLIGTARWKGVYLQTLLDAVGVKPFATRANFKAADDYFTSVTSDWILHPGTLLIYEMNGELLTPEHGYPLRILMPGLYGQKNPKWLTQIEFTDQVNRGYWERQGWSDTAEVRTNSIVEQPLNLATVGAGTVPVFGVAFAGKRKIVSVEVQVNDGDWQPADLVQADSNLVWTQWSLDWPAAPGKHTLAVRATDETGYVQTERGGAVLGDSYPAGTAKIHAVVVKVSAA